MPLGPASAEGNEHASSPTGEVIKRDGLPVWVWVLPLLWTALVGVALWWDAASANRMTREMAMVAARASFQRDVLYRRWSALHGGTYVPVTQDTPPNPLLTNVLERDITTPSGRRLTLINPAYMTRQAHELGRRTGQVSSHITSLKPIRPENAPDPWERQALEAIAAGAPEFSSVVARNGGRALRLMSPLWTERACLKCHEAQGYREGDLRGGISVRVPLDAYAAGLTEHHRAEWTAHGGVWLLGLMTYGLGASQVLRKRRERDRAHRLLRESEGLHRSLFEDSPVPMWEEDFSAVKARFDELRRDGVTDLRRWLDEHPEDVPAFARLVKVRAINRTAVEFLGAKSKEEVMGDLSRFFSENSLKVFKEEIIALADGAVRFRSEGEHLNVAGERLSVDFILAVQPGCERSLSRVVVSFVDITERRRAEEALRGLASSFAHLSDRAFFEAVSAHLAKALKVDFVFVGRLDVEGTSVVSLGGYARGQPMEDLKYDLAGTPCEEVVGSRFCLHRSGVQSMFPQDKLLAEMGIEAYAGALLFDSESRPLGILVALHSEPLLRSESILPVFQVFVDRVSAEIQRLRAEDDLRRRAEELRRRNDELIRFNRAATGRELRMIELKREVNDLHVRLGRPPKYAVGFAKSAKAGESGGAPPPPSEP